MLGRLTGKRILDFGPKTLETSQYPNRNKASAKD